MTAIVLRGLAARKLRTALTALAIVLGAAMVTGTLVMGHTVRSGFHEWYTKANGNSAAVITGHLTVRDNNSDVGTATPPLPAMSRAAHCARPTGTRLGAALRPAPSARADGRRG